MRKLRLTEEMRYILECGVPGATGLTRDDANALPFQYANAFTILLTEGMLYWDNIHMRYRATAKGTVALEAAASAPTPPATDGDEEA